MPQTIIVTVVTTVTLVKIGRPSTAMSGTESAEMNPPPIIGRVISCR